MRPLLAALALSVTLTLPFVPAHAQTTQRDPAAGFAQADTDHDGKLSFDEYKAMSDTVVARRVAEQPDGRLAKATPEQRATMVKRRFDNTDRNHDGTIDAAEWAKRPNASGQRSTTE